MFGIPKPSSPGHVTHLVADIEEHGSRCKLMVYYIIMNV